MVRALLAAGARVILLDMRGVGASDKPRDQAAYGDSAMARDVVALIEHLRLVAVDVIGFSMGAGTAARLLILRPPQVKSAILAAIGDYAIEDTILELPQNWPVPDSVPCPLTLRVWAEEGARILEKGEIVHGHLGSPHLIAARVTGADPKVLATVIRGAVAPALPAEQLRWIEGLFFISSTRNARSNALKERWAFLLANYLLPLLAKVSSVENLNALSGGAERRKAAPKSESVFAGSSRVLTERSAR